MKLAEGLETAEFWSQLGGKSKYTHFDPSNVPGYIRPCLYQCESNKDIVLFHEQPPLTKEELCPNHRYLLVYKEQVCTDLSCVFSFQVCVYTGVCVDWQPMAGQYSSSETSGCFPRTTSLSMQGARFCDHSSLWQARRRDVLELVCSTGTQADSTFQTDLSQSNLL